MSEAYKIEGKVGNRFTIVIPRKIREKIRLKEGESIVFWLDGNKIVIEPKRSDPFEKLDEIAGDIQFNCNTRKKADNYALKSSS